MYSYTQTFSAIWAQLSKPIKIRFMILAIMSFISSIFEMVSVGLLLPFIEIALNPVNSLNKFEMITGLDISILGISENNFLVYCVIVFSVIAIISGVIRLWVLWQTMYFSSLSTHHISRLIFKKILFQPIEYFSENTATDLLSSGTVKINEINNFLKHSATIFSASLISFGMIVILFITLPLYFISVMAGLLLFYLFISFYLSKRMRQNSKVIAKSTSGITQKFSDGVEDIKRISVLNLHRSKINAFKTDDINLRTAIAQSGFWASSPRYFLETIVLLFGLALILIESRDGNLINILPMLAVIVVAIQKTLPAMQSIYQSYSFIVRSYSSAHDCLQLLNLTIPENENEEILPCRFEESFSLTNFSYSFSKSHSPLFKDAEFSFQKNQSIAIIGPSGGGKSTLLEIIAGVRQIKSGQVTIDDTEIKPANMRAWQQHIDYVPQKVFIPDASLSYIITGEIDEAKIDYARLEQSKEICLINFDETGNADKDFAGARNRFSGGQIQRLGLARAIYNNRNVLILDEATSALDAKSEKLVIRNILNEMTNKTIIVCTHNPNNLDQFDKVFNISAGTIKAE